MNHTQLQDYALRCSLEHHLCNVEQLLDQGKTLDEILSCAETTDFTLAKQGGLELSNTDEGIVVWEPYEYYESASLAESICDLRGVYYHQLIYVLGKVNGEDWIDTYREGETK